MVFIDHISIVYFNDKNILTMQDGIFRLVLLLHLRNLPKKRRFLVNSNSYKSITAGAEILAKDDSHK